MVPHFQKLTHIQRACQSCDHKNLRAGMITMNYTNTSHVYLPVFICRHLHASCIDSAVLGDDDWHQCRILDSMLGQAITSVEWALPKIGSLPLAGVGATGLPILCEGPKQEPSLMPKKCISKQLTVSDHSYGARTCLNRQAGPAVAPLPLQMLLLQPCCWASDDSRSIAAAGYSHPGDD